MHREKALKPLEAELFVAAALPICCIELPIDMPSKAYQRGSFHALKSAPYRPLSHKAESRIARRVLQRVADIIL